MSPANRAERMEAAAAVALMEIACALQRPLTSDERLMLRVAFIKGANWTLSETNDDLIAAEAMLRETQAKVRKMK